MWSAKLSQDDQGCLIRRKVENHVQEKLERPCAIECS